MSKRTLILSPRHSEDSRLMRSAALRSGWHVERLTGWRVRDTDTFAGPVVAYGEGLFVEAMADQLGLELLQPAFDWLTHLPEDQRRRTVEFVTLAEAGGRPGPAFFKPADDKCFRARVYGSGAELPATEVLPDDTPVLIAEPVEWEVEYRCFVAGGAVRAHSIYARDGELARAADGSWPCPPDEEREALAFAAEVLAGAGEGSPAGAPAAVVLDVGRIRGRGWAAVELNPCWGSGLYGCDPAAALEVVASSMRARA